MDVRVICHGGVKGMNQEKVVQSGCQLVRERQGRALMKAVADKWLNETTEVVGDVQHHHHDKQSYLYLGSYKLYLLQLSNLLSHQFIYV